MPFLFSDPPPSILSSPSISILSPSLLHPPPPPPPPPSFPPPSILSFLLHPLLPPSSLRQGPAYFNTLSLEGTPAGPIPREGREGKENARQGGEGDRDGVSKHSAFSANGFNLKTKRESIHTSNQGGTIKYTFLRHHQPSCHLNHYCWSCHP